MRITIVTAYFSPEITPITHLYADLAQDLVKYGGSVTVVTSAPARGLTASEREAYRFRRDQRTPEGYRVLRVGKPGSEGSGLLRRGAHFLAGAVALYRAAKAVPTDVYLLGSMPPFLGPVGALLHRRARTVYILQDIFPDTMIRMGRYGEGHPFVRLGRWMERVSYRGNDRFVTLSADMAETLKSRGVPENRISVVGNWADTDAIRPVPRADNPLFDELGLDRDRFYVVYAGTLGPLQCPDLLLDTALLFFSERKEAKENNIVRSADRDGTEVSLFSVESDAKENDIARSADLPITFLIFGGGALLDHVRERIRREKIENVRLLPLLPPERSGEVYSLGDAALIPIAAGTFRCATPSKTWTAMAAGRPLIVTGEADSAFAKTVEAAGCGFVVPPGDAAALASAVRRAYENRRSLPALSENARRYAEKALSRESATKRYFEIVSEE